MACLENVIRYIRKMFKFEWNTMIVIYTYVDGDEKQKSNILSYNCEQI